MGMFRIFLKDAKDFFSGIRGILSILIAPVLIVIMVGQLRVQPANLSVMVAGDAPGDILSLVGTLSDYHLTWRSQSVRDPLTEIREGEIDLLANEEGGQWYFYAGQTSGTRLALVRQIVSALERILPEIEDPDEENIPGIIREVTNLGAVSTARLHNYYPGAADVSLSVLPVAIALISCFLPFAISSTTLIREKTAKTYELLLVSPAVTPAGLFTAKTFLPIVIGLFNFTAMLTACEFIYHIHIKSRFPEMMLIVFLGILASTLLGLAVSAVGRSQFQAVIASSVYFLLITLFSGFLFPLDEGAPLVQWISNWIPLTFINQILEGWMQGAGFIPETKAAVQRLAVQCLAFGGAAALLFRHSLYRI